MSYLFLSCTEKKLTESQKSFAENLETVKDIHASTDALRQVDAQWKKSF